MRVLTFSQRLPDLFRVSGQVEVGVPGLQVADRTAPPRHTKPLDEQICGQEEQTATRCLALVLDVSIMDHLQFCSVCVYLYLKFPGALSL